jgi:hypothetical protein
MLEPGTPTDFHLDPFSYSGQIMLLKTTGIAPLRRNLIHMVLLVDQQWPWKQ